MLLRRLFPHPILSLLLVVVWIMLVNKFTTGNLLLGVILGVLIPFVTQPYWSTKPKVKKPFTILVYVLIVLWDIVVANVVVAWTILSKPNRRIKSAWVVVPLDLKKPEAITILAGTITLTPGTVTSVVAADASALLVHTLDTDDPDGVRDEIKTRYERRLKEIFE